MNKIEIDFVELTRRTIIQQYEDDGFFDNTDWSAIYELANEGKLLALLLDVASHQKSLPADLKHKWEKARFSLFFMQKKNYHELRMLLDEMEEEGIKYACFKGEILAVLYSNPGYRSSADSDVLVSEDDAQAVIKMLVERGYEEDQHETKEGVYVYRNGKTLHTVELHTSLYEDYKGKKIDILKAGAFEDPSHFIKLKVQGKEMATLAHLDHLVYQLFHITKHFVLEGANVRFFTDITLFVNKYISEIDIKEFWNWMAKLDYTAFAENFFTVCIDNFGMDDTIMAGHKATASKEALEAMIVDFIYKGNASGVRQSSWQLTSTLSPYLVGELTTVKKSKLSRYIKFLFPAKNELGERYEYARNNGLLLPIAWVHRFFHKLFWSINEKEADQFSATEKAAVVESKLGLLGSVGLLNEE